MSDQIRAEVHQILTLARVTFKAEYRGLKKGALGGTHDMDQWLCLFTHEGRPNEPQEFDFFTGLGLRQAPKRGPFSWDNVQSPRELAAWKKANAKPIAPNAADVLHSLILDSSASEQSFGDWCADFGYSDDSIKARETYDACQRNADKLRCIINRETFNALQNALQDY